MRELALPKYVYKLTEIENKKCIFDPIRKKYVVLTPEEWVRQHFINLLAEHCKYPRTLMRVESGMAYNQLQKRTDLVVYDKSAKPFLLVECKAPEIKLNDAALKQASIYNQSLRAPFLAITNGLKTFCFEVDWLSNTTKQLSSLPTFPLN